MPRMDGTGPMGQGPSTGRRRGQCQPSENKANNSSSQTGGRGRGMGRNSRGGKNRGFRWNQAD